MSIPMFGLVIPLEDFAPWKGQWGAVQLGARFSHLDLNDKDVRGGTDDNARTHSESHVSAQMPASGDSFPPMWIIPSHPFPLRS